MSHFSLMDLINLLAAVPCSPKVPLALSLALLPCFFFFFFPLQYHIQFHQAENQEQKYKVEYPGRTNIFLYIQPRFSVLPSSFAAATCKTETTWDGEDDERCAYTHKFMRPMVPRCCTAGRGRCCCCKGRSEMRRSQPEKTTPVLRGAPRRC